jgi:hypothetical protein
MPGWWSRHMKWDVPEEILALAGGREKTPGTAQPLDIDALANPDGIGQARTYLAAASHKLKESYRLGLEDQVRLWSRLWASALDSLRKAEASGRLAKKQSGQLVSIAEVASEVAHFAETLRVMRLSMARRILGRLGSSLPEELGKRLGAAIEQERASEDAILRRLQDFRSLGDVTVELDAQASLPLCSSVANVRNGASDRF